MTSFTNINVSDTVLADTVTTNTLQCNNLNINTTSFGVSGSGLFNTIIPYNGVTTSLNASNVFIGGNLFIPSGNIIASGSTIFNGNVFMNRNGNISGDFIVSNNTFLNALSVSGNTSLSNVFISGAMITSNVSSGSISTNGIIVNQNANIFGNLTVGNVLIGTTLTTNANILCSNIVASRNGFISGNLSTGNISISGNSNIIGNLLVQNNSVFVGNTTFNSNVNVGNLTSKLINSSDIKAGNLDASFFFEGPPFNQYNSVKVRSGDDQGIISFYTDNPTDNHPYFQASMTGQLFGGNANVYNGGQLSLNAANIRIGEFTSLGPLYPFTQNVYLLGKRTQVSGNLVTLGTGRFDGILTNNNDVIMNQNLSLIGNVLTDFDCNANIVTLGNVIINSDSNINNALTIRSGFKGAVATNKFITYDVAGTGTHYFGDNIETTGGLVVGGSGSVVGSLNVTGTTTVQNFNFTDVQHSGVRIAEAYGAVFLATPTISANQFVPFNTPLVGTLDGIDTTNRWIRVNKQGQSITVGVKLMIIFEIGTGFTNTTVGSFTVNTSTSSAFTTSTDRTITRVIKAYTSSEVVTIILDFILPTTEEYFRVRYNGNAVWSFTANTSGGLSRYSVRTYL